MQLAPKGLRVTYDVIIVGGGLAKLCCALQFQQWGIRFLLLEASDAVGGRIRTDVVDGFRLDRGFQVFLTSYPEAIQTLDYKALQLRPFLAGAQVRHGGKFHLLADPWRTPLAAIRSLFSPIGSLTDKLRMAQLRSRSLKGNVEDRFRDPKTTTLRALQDFGFSTSMIDRFFRPFLGGIFLDPESVRWQPGVYVCGDHRDNALIQGAMVSGRRAAEAVLEDLS